MKDKKIVSLYFFIGSVYIVFHYFNLFIPMVISKSLIMPLLMLYYLYKNSFSVTQFRKFILLALFFSWMGDVLLMFTSMHEVFFMTGLVSFLIAHVFYIIAFIDPYQKRTIIRSKPYYILPFIIYGIILICLLYSNLGNMAFPVTIYASVILFLGIIALNRYKKVETKSFWLIFSGVILFIFSDSLIAIDKFTFPFRLSTFFIMSLYVLAQFLIVEGSIRQEY
ncbi:MAG: lysoplasmalogenase [Chlorobi bacterium]|nr:lysoplasmalogenase [Chlorobiota bacterium]